MRNNIEYGILAGLRKGDGAGTVVLDPTNNMPVEPNQRPAPGQKDKISTTRVQSTIPKGGTDSAWVYPSPQMFYNALVRKDKADDVTPKDMESVVSVHNGEFSTSPGVLVPRWCCFLLRHFDSINL